MSVRQWLASLAMTQYYDQFVINGFDTLAKCAKITELDLDLIGVTPPGHRRRLLSHLKTAQDFSGLNSETSEKETVLPDICSPGIEGNLIDLQSPVCSPSSSQEPPYFPIDLPPKMRRKEVDDALSIMDGSDGDKKKPVPMPRKSIQINQNGDSPVPKPRTKKPIYNVVGVTDDAINDCLQVQDSSENSKELTSGEKTYVVIKKLENCQEKTVGDEYDDKVLYADVIIEPSMKSMQVEPDLAQLLGWTEETKPSLPEILSPDTVSVLRLPLSTSYEGDVEDAEIIGDEDFDPFQVNPSVPNGKDGSDWYSGVWNMSSGLPVGHRRQEIKSDVSYDEFVSIESSAGDRSNQRNMMMAVPAVPQSSRSGGTGLTQLLIPLAEIQLPPPPVPARKPDLKCSNSAPGVPCNDPDVSSSPFTRLVQSDIEMNISDTSSFDSSPKFLKTQAPLSKTEVPTGAEVERVSDRLRFPTPPLRIAVTQATGANSPSSLQPSRAAPTPPGVAEECGKISHPPFPSLPFRTAPVPPPAVLPTCLEPFSRTVPAAEAMSSPADPLDVKVSAPPVKSGPPPLPPKNSALVSCSSESTYSLAGGLEEDDFGDESENHGDASFAESDDTLSDGGDFHADDILRQSIPIIQSTSTRQTSRKGYLHKLLSKSKKLTKLGPPWQKRWVVFDGNELRYYSSSKSFVSKRIIPLCTMRKVETETKNSDIHPFCFKLTTIDRVYTFAADDVDDMSWWASIIMQAIIQSENERENFIDCGEMNSPDIQGWVRMEGSKSRRYLVVKKAKFCFYNTLNDFKSFTPIHRVEMQLASIKDVGRFKLQLFTPHVAFMLIFESQEELNQWKSVFEDSISQGLGDDSVINEVYVNHSNRCCADCEMPDPEWSSINLGITLCKFCAGVHRSLSWSKVRSLRMDSKIWKSSVKQLLITIGNDKSNSFWAWKLPKEIKIDSKTDPTQRRDFILRKYCERLFCRFHPLHGKQSELNEALCKMVQFGNVFETLELVFSGADVFYSKNNETPIELARKAKQVLQEEFLNLNGGDMDALQYPVASGICHRGFLFKTGSNVKGEFLRRWCTLENGVFSYFDTDKSTVANDSIEKKDMLSIGLVVDERYEYTFEVGTMKQAGRTFLFAAESNEDRMLWMIKLAKVMADLDPNDIEKITPLERGGKIYIRWGSTREWVTTWALISHKTLKIFNKNDHVFEEVDLRKAKSITYRQLSERCVESYDDGPPFVVDLRNGKNVYIQGDLKNETERWFSVVQKAITEADRSLANQSLTSDNVPVIVEKCIDFVVLYGLEVEGIYRLNGQHSKVTRLLDLFMADACNLVIKQEDFQVHDVSNTFKRFFRSLDDPLLTHRLYRKWIEAAGLTDLSAKTQRYKSLLKELPEVNYCTLKQVISHLTRVVESERINKMTVINLASIFGPVLMRLDKDKGGSGYGATNFEINVVRDLIENHICLFEVKEEELEQEKKIEEARKKIEMLNNQPVENQIDQMQDVIIGVHINNKEGEAIFLKVSHQMRVLELQNYVITKAQLDPNHTWSLFEVICNGELERPLHYNEGVIDCTMKWMNWPMEFCRDNYLCLKRNYVFEKIFVGDIPHLSLFSELKYASKKNFHKYCFDFSRYCLTYRANAKASVPTASWNIEDLIIYIGSQRQRNPPSRFCFSFICTNEQLVSPFFGHCVCCNSEDELYKWLSVLIRAQHPEGFVSSGSPMAAGSPGGNVQLRSQGSIADQETSDSSRPRWLKPISIFQKLNLR